nr:uncharacterized mitochondrial protein AtMg00810-like [Tanacetum cinerariifolium]
MISIPNEDLSDDTTPSVAQKFLNEVKSSLVTLQRVVKQKMTLEVYNWSSSAHKEVHRIISHEIASIINQVEARVQNFEIQFLQEAAKFVRNFKSLAKEADESLDKQKSLELEINHLKSTYKNLFDSIKSNRAHAKLHDLIFENAKLRARLFEKTSESVKNTSGTSMTSHGIIRFGNDHITAILGYGDLEWGNITITRVYFVKGLGHNLFSVGQFCDADLEFKTRTSKYDFWINQFRTRINYAPSTITPQRPSERDMDILFEPLHNEYLGGRPTEAPRAIPAVPQQRNLTLSLTASAADNVPNAVFEGDLFVNRFGTPSTESVVSSTQYVDPSNMHTFYQPYPRDYQWIKDHLLEQVIGEPSRPSKYVHEILKKYGLNTSDIVGTLMDIKDKLNLDQIGTPVDAMKYRSMIGAFMYLTSNRPDIVHATYDSGFELTGFSDADYVGCKDTFKSTSDGAHFLGKKLMRWSSKKQDCTSLSTVK